MEQFIHNKNIWRQCAFGKEAVFKDGDVRKVWGRLSSGFITVSSSDGRYIESYHPSAIKYIR